ncbi:RNA polymerase, sigma-24 subunit, ECF subfamily [Deinococcus grandis]|uniref:RNA polymerase, sigma-24 subunit, ECF subfamily n=1 Tax=Deinococcus grandis TaxID=57498 RepID=A0A100HN67_9DEIO|nr:RNA polymerase [Deinococcus grandis]GAQ23783.1 RNA polymerase, sigma-24 subunit, ECF subfamily [Deinococcus grandis]
MKTPRAAGRRVGRSTGTREDGGAEPSGAGPHPEGPARRFRHPLNLRAAVAVLDAALAGRLVRRDEAALAEIYDAHAAAVFGVLVHLLDHATAQEVHQDVFVRLWDRPEAFDPARAGLRAYLLVMARSRALDRLRGARVTVPLHGEDGVTLPLPDGRPSLARLSEDRARRDCVHAALSGLSGAHRETVERAYLRGESREEIARAMDVPVGTVKSRLSYALKHLKRHLGEEGGAWLD